MKYSFLIGAAIVISAQVFADEPIAYSATAAHEYPTEVYWGDTHLHTELSQDANQFGVKLDSEGAYRFARGGTLTSSNGQTARLKRPLDFLVIADHAEGLGAMSEIRLDNEELMKSPRLRQWRDWLKKGDVASALELSADGRANGWPAELDLSSIRRPAWETHLKAADKYNEPGVFTALHGFEWTSWPGGSNLHRVVIFRDNFEKTSQLLPLSSIINDDPEALWEYMDGYESTTGGKVLAIPHNGNISNGLMFQSMRMNGEAMNADYARQRASKEPLYEVTQIKGDGEAHPLLSPNDEFADYETWDKGNFDGVPKTPEMLPSEYAREALKTGLKLEQEVGTNPFKFGMIGSTDSHTSLSTPEEDNFYGKHSAGQEPSPHRAKVPVGKAANQTIMGWEQAASGYAAVWARENTRESLWDAMKRKETYATTGSRITLRAFAGWDFKTGDDTRSDYVEIGYQQGVPMGGDLTAAPKGKSPKLLIVATKDPLSGNLDRVQVVKGWVDSNGETQENVYDVVWSDPKNRKLKKGKLTPVGDTVDVETASYTNSIGAPELSTVWQDPDFDSAVSAFYYVRVLEIPTPRWTTVDAFRFGTEIPEGAPKTTQERAYGSPIWYTP